MKRRTESINLRVIKQGNFFCPTQSMKTRKSLKIYSFTIKCFKRFKSINLRVIKQVNLSSSTQSMKTRKNLKIYSFTIKCFKHFKSEKLQLFFHNFLVLSPQQNLFCPSLYHYFRHWTNLAETFFSKDNISLREG